MLLQVAARGGEVVERRLRLGKPQLHETAGGVVDVDQQRAGRTPILEPGVLAAVDLYELAAARATLPGRVAAPSASSARQPDAVLDHPAAQRLDGQLQAVLLGELLVRQGRPEVAVALTDQLERPAASLLGSRRVARLAALGGDQAGGAVSLEDAVQPADLTLGKAQQLTRVPLGQPPLGDARHDLQSVQLLVAQCHVLRHATRVARNRTFLNWRNRTFALWTYNPVSDIGRYDKRPLIAPSEATHSSPGATSAPCRVRSTR